MMVVFACRWNNVLDGRASGMLRQVMRNPVFRVEQRRFDVQPACT
jgi:hypothetical protein